MGNVSGRINGDTPNADIELNLGIPTNIKKESIDRVCDNVRTQAVIANEKKKGYGDGISVKGMVVNVAGAHFLQRTDLKRESGKDWTDGEVLEPPLYLGILAAGAFFHAKRDSAATGTRAGMEYSIIDAEGYIKGYVAFAWENPYSGPVATYCAVSNTPGILQAGLDWCDSNSGTKIVGKITKVKDAEAKDFITAHAWVDDESTAWIAFSCNTDDMIRKTEEI
jgi:hypothetical protein